MCASMSLLFHVAASLSSGVQVRLPYLLAAVLVWWCVVPALSDNDCQPITLGEGSPLYPRRTKNGHVTMYRIFHTEGNPHELNITWVREPSNLSLSSKRCITKPTYSSGAVKASITLWDLMINPDFGSYTVMACNNCTCNETVFFLYLSICNPESMPQPVEQYERTIIAETSLSNVLHVYMIFEGNPNKFFYPTSWTHNDAEVCHEDKNLPSYSCNRTVYGDCAFTANLYIYHPTHKDSGNYTVQAIGNNQSSQNSTYRIDIVREPAVTCEKHKINIGHVKCSMRNYSQFVNVSVVKDNITLVSTYPAEKVCKRTITDETVADCSILLDRNGQFRVCANYTNSVTHNTNKLQCSGDIHVRNNIWNKRMVGKVVGGVGALLVVVLSVVGLIVYLVKKWRRRGTQGTGEPDSTDGTHDTSETDDTSETQRLLPGESTNRSYETLPAGPTPRTQDTGETHDMRESDDISERQRHVHGENTGYETVQDVPIAGPTPRLHPASGATPNEAVERDSGATRNISTASERRPSPKVTLFYAQNPELYLQIYPPEEMLRENPRLLEAGIIAQYEEDCLRNGRYSDNNVSRQRGIVREFAEFLQRAGIRVSYDQQIEDRPVVSKTQWMQEEIKDSDYVVFIITPSFQEFMKIAPQKELFFQGSYLCNLIDNLETRVDGSAVNMVSVFLDRPIELKHVPTALRSGHTYSVWTPFQLHSQRKDDLNQLLSLIKHGHR